MKQNLKLIQTTQPNAKRMKTLLMTLLLSLFTLIGYSQQWVIVDSVRFNGLPYGYDYPNNGSTYFNDATLSIIIQPVGYSGPSGPYNGIINTRFEVVDTTLPSGPDNYALMQAQLIRYPVMPTADVF